MACAAAPPTPPSANLLQHADDPVDWYEWGSPAPERFCSNPGSERSLSDDGQQPGGGDDRRMVSHPGAEAAAYARGRRGLGAAQVARRSHNPRGGYMVE